MTASQITQVLSEKFAGQVLSVTEFRGEHTITCRLEIVKTLLKYCCDELSFDYLVDVSSVDNFGSEPRYEMVYELYGYSHHQHLRVKCPVSEDEEAPTVSDLWPAAEWHEREVYDMMGIGFEGHPDLRRILMWEGYPFHPLQKDFPLAGRPSDMPDVAFTGIAPLEGGPFVTSPGAADTIDAEPRAKRVE